jgi:hypothetical protein
MEANLRNQVGRMRTFAGVEKIRELVARTPSQLTLEDQNAFEHGLQNGCGGVSLLLTREQMAALWNG